MPKGRGRKGNAPPRKRKKNEEIVTRKHFTEIINEADSDEDDKTCTNSYSTSLAAADIDEGPVLDHTVEHSSHPSITFKEVHTILTLVKVLLQLLLLLEGYM